MNIVPLLLFCSLALVLGSILLFVFSAKQGDCHEAERLCLLPLEDDAGPPPEPPVGPDGRSTPSPEPR
ncbi:MAG: cytochrome oxidase [Planctomycetes bacterium]|nr:cytochrome oxidase [Planctomycetota bacterium]